MGAIIIPVSLARRRLLLGAAGLLAASVCRATDYQEISWDELVPDDWDPAAAFRDLQHLGALPDSDARVQALYERMRKTWDSAPTVAAMAGRAVRLPGYVVPLEAGPEGLREFLLVPYFGACIHTPPPPANQIIHVRSAAPVKGLRTMDAVWVEGTLGLERSASDMGASGYSLAANKIKKFESDGN